MNKAILVVLALFAIVSAEQFRTLNFNQGKLLLRNLATASGKSYAYQDYSGNTGVTVNLGTSYLTSAGIDAATQTDMLLLLYTNATGFCTNCDKLVPFKCADNSCKADTNSKLQSLGPHFYVKNANPFSIPVTIGSDWKLQDNGALLYTSSASQYSTNDIDYPSGSGGTKSFGYIGNASTYGWVGLGADGNAAKNFQSDHPLFSLSVSGAGSGQLIFGKDSTKFGQYPTPQVFNSTANWTMPFINISIGANMDTLTTSKNYVFTIIPDLQSPGLGLPSYSFNNILNKMVETYKLEVDTTLGNFTYVYKGELTGLPNIVFGLTNEQNFTIPPCAYTRKVADGVYNILLYSLSYFWDSDASLNQYTAVLGWPVLSQFYTVFEKQANINATISFYSLNANIPGTSPYPATTNPTTPTTSTSSWKTIIIIVLVVLVALIVLSFALKKKNNLTKSDLGVELRAARV